jgi:hypothetical protein
MKGVAALLLIIPSLALAAAKVHLYILAGQSNALGNGSNASSYPYNRDVDARIRFYWVEPGLGSSGGDWTTLKPQPGIYPEGHFGPEVSLARSAYAAGVQNIAVFKFAKGSTSLFSDWRPGDPSGLFAALSNEMTSAIDALRKHNPPKTECFIWIQGESDAENQEKAAAYGRNLAALLRLARWQLGKNVRIVVGMDEQHPWVMKNPIVIEHQMKLAAQDNNMRFVSMIGLAKADSSHLTSAGVTEHGKRIFDACAK